VDRKSIGKSIKALSFTDLSLIIIVIIVIVACLLLAVRCDESASSSGTSSSSPKKATAQQHILTNIPDASASVDTTVTFPGLKDPQRLHFRAGEKITALLGLRNVGDSQIELQAVCGSMNAPQAFHFHVSNFTKYTFDEDEKEQSLANVLNPRGEATEGNRFTSKEQAVVNAGRELTIPYTFQMPVHLAGMDWTLALTAFYGEDGEQYATTFFNHTVKVLDPIVTVDLQLGFVYLSLVCVALFVVYFVLRVFGLQAHIPFIGENAIEANKQKKKENFKAARANAAATMSANTAAGGVKSDKKVNKDDDWLSGTAFTNPSSFAVGGGGQKNVKNKANKKDKKGGKK
jgi:hypothetical protein